MEALRACLGAAVFLCLAGCARPPVSAETAIERGDATLLPDTVEIGTGIPVVISATVQIQERRVQVAVLATDCDDRAGSIRVFDTNAWGGFTQTFAFARGERPGDQLFVKLCEMRRNKRSENGNRPSSSP